MNPQDDNQKRERGRPLKFKDVTQLNEKIEAYFKSCWDFQRDMWGNRLRDKGAEKVDGKLPFLMKQVKPYTITGLAVFLETSRDVLIDYESGMHDDPDKTDDLNQDFSNTIKNAKAAIYAYAEEQLFSGKQAAGPIFNLKNNWGWVDKTQVENHNYPTPIMGGSSVHDDDRVPEDNES